MVKFCYIAEYHRSGVLVIRGFSFYDEDREMYKNFMGSHIWENIDEFKFCYKRTGLIGELSLQSYLDLIPKDWNKSRYICSIDPINDEEDGK